MPKQMTKAERAEYMRVYRAKKKREEVAAGEIEVRRETPVVDTSDTSTAARSFEGTHGITKDWGIHGAPPTDAERAAFKRAEYERVKPAFLAAPDDDCASCGHDRQTYHLNADGKCWAPALHKRSRRCECPAFLDPAEPF